MLCINKPLLLNTWVTIKIKWALRSATQIFNIYKQSLVNQWSGPELHPFLEWKKVGFSQIAKFGELHNRLQLFSQLEILEDFELYKLNSESRIYFGVPLSSVQMTKSGFTSHPKPLPSLFLSFSLVRAVESQIPQFQNNSCQAADTEGHKRIRGKGPRWWHNLIT